MTNSNERPSWPQRMLGNAEYWAQFSTCVRRKVGAVIYNPENWAVLSSGYNDTARGEVNCGDGGCAICQEGPASDKIDCNCVVEGQRILTADLRWVPIQDVEIGQSVLGFVERETVGVGQRRCLTARATVTDKVGLVKEAFEYRFSDGSALQLTSDHRVFTFPSPLSTRAKWMEIGQVPIGDHVSLRRWLRPWEPDCSRNAGWLAGFFDGEGSISPSNDGANRSKPSLWISAAQAEGPTLDEFRTRLDAMNFRWSGSNPMFGAGVISRKPAQRTSILGGWPEQARFLGQVRPMRLLSRWLAEQERFLGGTFRTSSIYLTDVTPLGRQQVWDISTTTENFILEGVAVHNCIHAEMNAILMAASRGVRLEGMMIVSTYEPCGACRKHIKQAGLTIAP